MGKNEVQLQRMHLTHKSTRLWGGLTMVLLQTGDVAQAGGTIKQVPNFLTIIPRGVTEKAKVGNGAEFGYGFVRIIYSNKTYICI